MKVTGASTAASGIQVWKGMAPGLAGGSDHHQDEGRGGQAGRLDGDLGHRRGAGHAPEQADAEDHREIAEAADEQGLDRRPPGRRAAADRDHAVQGDQQAFPEEDQRHEVVGQDGPVGEGRGQEDVGHEFPAPGRVLHLDGRVDRDEEEEARQGEEDEAREVVEAEVEVDAHARARGRCSGGPSRRRGRRRNRGATPAPSDGQGVAKEPQRPRQDEQDDGQDGRQEDREKEHFGRHRSHQLICVVATFTSFIG